MIKPNPKSKLWAELAWRLYEHLPAGAADGIMNWRLRCSLPFKNLHVPVFFMRGFTPIYQRKATLLFAGKNPRVNYLVQRFFEGEIQQEMVAEVPLWKLPQTLKRLRTSADLTIVEIDHFSAKLLFDSSYLVVPTWVDLVLKTPEEPEKIARGNRSLKRDLRIVRRNNLTFDISRAESDFEMFYHTMYKPFILNRHGEYAGIRDFRWMYRMFRKGGLQWILRNGERIAGRIFQRRGKVFKFVAHGMVNGEWSNVKAGAVTALYFFGIIYAKKTGCRLIDLGRCRPSLGDGVLRYKRKWGAGLNKNDIEFYDFLVYWNGFSEPISSFLSHTPLIFRDHDELSAIHVIDTAGQTDVNKTSRSMWIPGLHRLYLVSASGGQTDQDMPDQTILIDLKDKKEFNPNTLHIFSKQAAYKGGQMKKYDFASLKMYQELNDWCSDRGLINLAKACIEAQKQAAASVFQTTFKPDRQAAADAVSEEKLESILKSGRDVHGIATERDISNVIAFNARNIEDSVNSGEVKRLRNLVDDAVSEKIKESFKSHGGLSVIKSGHFWYPAGAYMGWHTNSGAPGWRMYINHAEEPGKSFFRYRDPDTNEIITSTDNEWNVRIFEIRSDKLLWHAVYSDTNRFSLGYMIYPKTLITSIEQKLKRLLRA